MKKQRMGSVLDSSSLYILRTYPILYEQEYISASVRPFHFCSLTPCLSVCVAHTHTKTLSLTKTYITTPLFLRVNVSSTAKQNNIINNLLGLILHKPNGYYHKTSVLYQKIHLQQDISARMRIPLISLTHCSTF